MFTEIVLECGDELAERLSDALLEAGALAVSIEDARAGTLDEQPLYGEPGIDHAAGAFALNRLVVLFGEGTDPLPLLAAAEHAIGLSAPLPRVTRRVADTDWVRQTQAQFDPIHIGSRIFIVPSWHPRPPSADPNAVLIELDPGLAFGTGSHATTRLCLEWLESAALTGRSVIDYGCGSGILAIAAARLGASRVVATDIDPQALTATRSNSQNNMVQIEIYPAAALPAMQADVVMANILSNPLKLLAPLLCRRVASGGTLVISGVLERQIDELCLAYQDQLALSVWRERDGWVCLVGQVSS